MKTVFRFSMGYQYFDGVLGKILYFKKDNKVLKNSCMDRQDDRRAENFF